MWLILKDGMLSQRRISISVLNSLQLTLIMCFCLASVFSGQAGQPSKQRHRKGGTLGYWGNWDPGVFSWRALQPAVRVSALCSSNISVLVLSASHHCFWDLCVSGFELDFHFFLYLFLVFWNLTLPSCPCRALHGAYPFLSESLTFFISDILETILLYEIFGMILEIFLSSHWNVCGHATHLDYRNCPLLKMNCQTYSAMMKYLR